MSNDQTTKCWMQDCDPQWWTNEHGDAVRGPKSYKVGGWWFLPHDKPDHADFDVGPFKTRREAMEHARG